MWKIKFDFGFECLLISADYFLLDPKCAVCLFVERYAMLFINVLTTIQVSNWSKEMATITKNVEAQRRIVIVETLFSFFYAHQNIKSIVIFNKLIIQETRRVF